MKEENEKALVALETIQSKIYEIRGVKVMLDFDLAKLYGVETRSLKQSVRRNMNRFDEDFMFTLDNNECNHLIHIGVSQNVIPKGYNTGGSNIMAFTELGVAMLSSVLRSEIAIGVNKNIMRAFVATRQMLYAQEITNKRIENLQEVADRQIGKLEQDMRGLKEYIEEVFTDYNDINEDTRIQLELINMTLAELQCKIKEKESEPELKPRNPIGFKK